MRIVDRTSFLALPKGTVFHTYEPQVMGPLSVKMSGPGRLSNDWYEWEPGDPDNTGSMDRSDRLDEMGADPTVDYPLDMSYGRDGMYEDDAMFIVYSDVDVFALVGGLLVKWSESDRET